MARAIWSGTISFGLVNVPVKLYTATETKDVRFRELRQGTGERIRHRRVAEESGEEIPYEDVVKGYEVERGTYVTVSREELEAVAPEKSRAIEIEDFVDLAEVDPIHYQKTYYLAPDGGAAAQKAYALLRDAMAEEEKTAIGRFVMRTKEYLAAIRPSDGMLLLETMFFADEIREPKAIEGIPVEAQADERELEVARQLVGSMASAWAAERYRDTHRERVLELIGRKAEGKELVTERPAESEAVGDIMEALERSLEAVRERKAG